MVSLANLARYQGRYDVWAAIRNRYSLKWTSGNESLQALQRFFNPDCLTLETMLQQVRQMIKILPPLMGQIVKFGTLVGLRSAEIVESVRLINRPSGKFPEDRYYNPEQQALLHYKFPQFLRTTKKAYLSFVTPDMLQEVRTPEWRAQKVPSYNAIRLTCQRRGITCDMRYCRKIHATYLYQEGIPVEIIDALQGRTPASLFAKHYYRPSLDYREKVLQALHQLQKQL
jgi:intergrase/recombinase